jgi:hypothetical protein
MVAGGPNVENCVIVSNSHRIQERDKHLTPLMFSDLDGQRIGFRDIVLSVYFHDLSSQGNGSAFPRLPKVENKDETDKTVVIRERRNHSSFGQLERFTDFRRLHIFLADKGIRPGVASSHRYECNNGPA